jgi:predicted 3-demethylubiquinone-9 3-methyltransferase (glyoxalase superfamily)
MAKISQKITTFLWFDNQAEEAARFYTSLFESSRIVAIDHYPDAVPDKAGSVMLVTFELAGQKFRALSCSSNAKPKAKSMSFGASSPRAARNVHAVG